MILLKNINQIQTSADFSKILAEIIEPMKLSGYGRERVYFGIGNYQGGRLILQIVVHASEIPALIPANPRPKNADHDREIKDYILRRIAIDKAWILGSLTVNVNPEQIRAQKIGSNLYAVVIPNGTPFQITDGQHRIQAITELMASGTHQRLIADEQIPLTLVLDGDVKQADKDFRDMAQTMPLPPAILVSFAAEGRDAIAYQVASRVNLFRHSTQMAKVSPGTGTKYIYTLSYIAGLVGCAIVGKSNAQLSEYDTPEKIEEIAEVLSNVLNRFFSLCPITAFCLYRADLSIAEVADFKNKSILGLSIGLEILGHLIRESLNSNQPENSVTIEQIATQIDWSRNSDWWSEIVSPDKKVASGPSGATASLLAERAVQRLRSLAR